jgi:hypothetical protein
MRNEQTLNSMELIQMPALATQKSNLNRLVMEAVDEVLSALGDSCKQAIYLYLKSECNMSRNDIPKRIPDFSDALEQLFGPGAGLIEIQIMKRLRKKVPQFRHSPKNQSLSFDNYIASLSSFV